MLFTPDTSMPPTQGETDAHTALLASEMTHSAPAANVIYAMPNTGVLVVDYNCVLSLN